MTNKLPNCVEWTKNTRAILEKPLKELWEEVNKMRLIDADKLKEELKVNSLGYQYYMLDNEPTVEAIPIEQIVKRINYYSDLILTYPNEKELLYRQTELISLLEDWEKEERG